VDHAGTVDRSDDRWYLSSAAGGVTEIVRVWKDGEERFYLKDKPYWKVEVDFLSTAGPQQMRKIAAWRVTDPSGICYRYGARRFSGEPGDGDSYVCRRWIGVVGNRAVRTFDEFSNTMYYQWDLAQVTDPSGGLIKYTWNYIDDMNHTQEGYPERVESDNGDVVEFVLNTRDRTHNEMKPQEASWGDDPNYMETKYLHQVLLKDAAGTVLNRYQFDYTMTTEFVNAFKQGFAKRLLRKLTCTASEEGNYRFEYYDKDSDYDGYLKSVEKASGVTKTFTYDKVASSSDLKVVCNEAQMEAYIGCYDGRYATITDTTNHIFIVDTADFIDEVANQTSEGTKLEVLDAVNGRWDQWRYSDPLPGVSYHHRGAHTRFLPYTKCYPFGDRIVIVREDMLGTPASAQHMTIFEYHDGEWKNTYHRYFSSASKSHLVNRVQVFQGTSYVMVWEPVEMIIYIFQKVNGQWRSTFNSPSGPTAFPNGIEDEYGHDEFGEGWNWPNEGFIASGTQRAAMHTYDDYFMFTYKKHMSGETHPRICAQVFKWMGGTEWRHVEADVGAPGSNSMQYAAVNGYGYRYSDVLTWIDFDCPEENEPVALLRKNYYVVYWCMAA
jgi:hypothetical protein